MFDEKVLSFIEILMKKHLSRVYMCKQKTYISYQKGAYAYDIKYFRF